jgi:hypothetical protein
VDQRASRAGAANRSRGGKLLTGFDVPHCNVEGRQSNSRRVTVLLAKALKEPESMLARQYLRSNADWTAVTSWEGLKGFLRIGTPTPAS